MCLRRNIWEAPELKLIHEVVRTVETSLACTRQLPWGSEGFFPGGATRDFSKFF